MKKIFSTTVEVNNDAMMDLLNKYRNKRVLITGHTGFKGRWLAKWLLILGAKVTGFSLQPSGEDYKVFSAILWNDMYSVTGDIRDYHALKRIFENTKPEIVFHLAAQPLVIESYHAPLETYATNVMGVVNVLECIRLTDTVKSFLNITTDKVYENREWLWGYREDEKLDGFDPYSNSKSCAELVTHSYKRSFFADGRCAISTARAGNVIGGGDFSANRIIPDCVRSACSHEDIFVRNPRSIRPYQHVLEPLYAYLLIAMAQYIDGKYADWYNVGPNDENCIATGDLAELFCEIWGEEVRWYSNDYIGPYEASFLKLDCAKLKNIFGWQPRWTIRETMEKTVIWAKEWRDKNDISALMDNQIKEFMQQCGRGEGGV